MLFEARDCKSNKNFIYIHTSALYLLRHTCNKGLQFKESCYTLVCYCSGKFARVKFIISNSFAHKNTDQKTGHKKTSKTSLLTVLYYFMWALMNYLAHGLTAVTRLLWSARFTHLLCLYLLLTLLKYAVGDYAAETEVFVVMLGLHVF